MDKKNSHIMVNLVNRRFDKSDIQYIKKNADLNEILKILSVVYKKTKNF